MSCNWPIVKLGDYCSKIGSGATPKGGNSVYLDNGEISLIRSQNVYNDGFKSDGLAYITPEAAQKLKNVIIEPNDVLINITGDSVARVCLAPNEFLPARVNQHVAILRVVPEEFDHRYLRYYLTSTKMQNYLLTIASTGGTRNALTKLMLESLEVSKPPLNVQKKIGDVLEQFENKILINTKTNQTLEEMAQAIFKSWFVDFDPIKAKINGEQPEGMDEATASLFPEKLVESELGLIPEGWTVKPFKKVIDKYVDNRGKTPPVVEDGIPLVEVKHLPENSAFPNLNTDKRVTEETFNTWFRVHVEPKDVLISTVGTIGRTSFVKNTNFGIAQNVLGLRFGKVVEPEYMFYTIKSHRFQHDMDARLVTTVQSSIKRKDLDTIDILIPPSNVQKEFCKLVGSLLDGQYSKNAENIELASLRDTLLPKLLSGEIELAEKQEN